MKTQENILLAPFTSFQLGGNAEHFVEVHNTSELMKVLSDAHPTPIWLLGFGSNTLISDKGLPGLVICMRGGTITREGDSIIADAGTWWDDVVKTAIANNLWGIELLSEVPGSVGAALFINITAYGQSIGPLVEWIDVWDTKKHAVKRLDRSQLNWDYKTSIFQLSKNSHYIILRTSLKLKSTKTDEIQYQKAIDVAEELGLTTDSLEDRRTIIIEARRRAGSLWHPSDTTASKTAGSFFRNPEVSEEVAELVMSFDESGKSTDEIRTMNHVHGGKPTRVSAAHVMLAAGFSRGQSWGVVKLNDQNLLKIEALPGATAQDVFYVATEIQQTVAKKLGIILEPEARILGDFSNKS